MRKIIERSLFIIMFMLGIIICKGLSNNVYADTATDENGITWTYDIWGAPPIIHNLKYESGNINGELIIPSELEGQAVTNLDYYGSFIEDTALRNSITKVIIPDSITSIGSNNFSGWTSLTEVIIPESVTTIERNAFSNTPFYNNMEDGVIYLGKVLYTYKGDMPNDFELVIPEGIVGISPYAFYERSMPKSIKLPGTLKTIGSYAFYNTGIENIVIGDIDTKYNHLLILNSSCFNRENMISFVSYVPVGVESSIGGTNLKSAEFLGGISGIGSNCFSGCTNLSNIVFGELPDDIDTSEDNYWVGGIGELAFYNCSSLTSITLPKNIDTLGAGAFSMCSNLQEFIVNGTLTSVAKDAFKGTKLVSSELFSNDDTITSAIVPEGVSVLEEFSFYNSKNLKNIHLPSTLSSISSKAFYGCNSLENVTIAEDNQNFSVEDGIIYSKDKTVLIRCLPGKDNSVKIPNTVTTIQPFAFKACSKLKGEIIIPGNVTTISNCAFQGCTSEVKLVISEGVTTIGYSAFANSKFTGDLIIPNSVTSLGRKAFFNCYNLNGNLRISNNISYIHEYTFYNCYNLKGDIIIPDKLTSIDRGAFKNCSGFDGSLILEERNEERYANQQAFAYCAGIQKIIGKIDSVSEGAFYGCTSLKNTGEVGRAQKYCFAECTNLEEVNVTNWGGTAFNNCSKIETLRVGERTYMDNYMIARCENLKTVYIPASVTSISEKAIYKCNNLRDIYVEKKKSEVNYDEILRGFGDNITIHYLDSMYTIEKTLDENIEIEDVTDGTTETQNAEAQSTQIQNVEAEDVKTEETTEQITEEKPEKDQKYLFGSTYKFRVVAKDGYILNNVKVILKIRDKEQELTPQVVDGEEIYMIENIENDMELIVTGDTSVITI
ncbi:MAG: leucine-rich repeat protein [Clostridia bacterium]